VPSWRSSGRRASSPCSPPRAAKRLSESTGLEAKTIHRLLEFDPKEGGFLRGADLALECDLLVLDEVSMIDVPLMASVLQALPQHAALLSLAMSISFHRWDPARCSPT
jgi:ATP-dependent exoDNAse (exonuclease V) alpha subunit